MLVLFLSLGSIPVSGDGDSAFDPYSMGCCGYGFLSLIHEAFG